MKKLIPIFILIFAFSTLAVVAQDDLPIIGDISNIKNLKKVYIVTESTKDRKVIVSNLSKKNLAFEIVNDPAEAEFFIEFKTISRQDKKTFAGSEYNEIAEMKVYFYNADKKKVVAWSQTEEHYEASGISMEKPNVLVLSKKFVKAFTGKD